MAGARPRVCMDLAGSLQPDTGAGRHTVSIYNALAREGTGIDLVGFVNSWNLGRHHGLPGKIVNPRLPSRLLLSSWSSLGWPPIEYFVGAVDIFHSSDWVIPPSRKARLVCPLHDVGPLRKPAWYAPAIVRHHWIHNERIARHAAAIVAVSEFSRREFLEIFGGNPRRIHVVPNGIDTEYRPLPKEAQEEALYRHGVRRPFVLYVGTRERRKNVVGLIRAFARIAAANREVVLLLVGMRTEVEGNVIDGSSAWSAQEVSNEIRRQSLRDRVWSLGRVSQSDLIALYSAASVFATASLYEGFCLPVIEAMACGAPVVAGAGSALSEVAGDAALLGDPENSASFGDLILRVLAEPLLAAELRTKGLQRARAFSWSRSAGLLLSIYEGLRSRAPELR